VDSLPGCVRRSGGTAARSRPSGRTTSPRWRSPRRSRAPVSTRTTSRTSTSAARTRAGEDNRKRRAHGGASRGAATVGSPGVTVNRLCASGLTAVAAACHARDGGRRRPVRRGRRPSRMTRATVCVSQRRTRRTHAGTSPCTTHISAGAFRIRRWEEMFPLESMGETGENVAERYGITREGPGRVRARFTATLGSSRRGWAFSTRSSWPRSATSCATSIRGRTRRWRKLATLKPAFPRGRHGDSGGIRPGINDGRCCASWSPSRGTGRAPLGVETARHVRRQRGRGRRSTGHGNRSRPRGAQACSRARGRRRRATSTSSS